MDKNTSIIIASIIGVQVGWMLRRVWTKYMSGAPALVSSSESFADSSAEFKLVLVVRNDLKMGKGKIAAQCSHASVLAYRRANQSDESLLTRWESQGQRKVVVKVDDEAQLFDIEKKARNQGLLTSIIRDAGRTQIAAGSITVLGIGPGPQDVIDDVSGHLKLL